METPKTVTVEDIHRLAAEYGLTPAETASLKITPIGAGMGFSVVGDTERTKAFAAALAESRKKHLGK